MFNMNCCKPDANNADMTNEEKMQSVHIPEEGPKRTSEEMAQFNYPSIYESHLSSVLISNAEIKSRVKEISEAFQESYPLDEPLVLICTLKGANPFFAALLDELSVLSIPFIFEFLRVKSYIGTESSGDVKVMSAEFPSVKGRHVIVVEDIVDTGGTLQKILPMIQSCGPKTVEVCTLLKKRLSQGNGGISPKYTGFTIPDAFVVGYGLDYNEMYRDLRDIWILGERGIAFGGWK